MNKPAPYITGLYGCSCHPYKSWEECEFFHKQKFLSGDKVRQRHTGKEGKVCIKTDSKYFCSVSYGPNASDRQLEHSADLIRL